MKRRLGKHTWLPSIGSTSAVAFLGRTSGINKASGEGLSCCISWDHPCSSPATNKRWPIWKTLRDLKKSKKEVMSIWQTQRLNVKRDPVTLSAESCWHRYQETEYSQVTGRRRWQTAAVSPYLQLWWWPDVFLWRISSVIEPWRQYLDWCDNARTFGITFIDSQNTSEASSKSNSHHSYS